MNLNIVNTMFVNCVFTWLCWIYTRIQAEQQLKNFINVLSCFVLVTFLGKYIKPCGIIFWGFWENICYWNEILIMLLLIYGRLVQKNKSRSSFWGMFASHIRLLTHLRLCHEAALLIQFIHIIGPLHSRRP